jgi:hypothetical protein
MTRGGSSMVPYSMLWPLGIVMNILGVTTTTCERALLHRHKQGKQIAAEARARRRKIEQH